METHRLKKDNMRDAKVFFIITIISLLCVFQCPAQTLNGTYHRVDGLTAARDVGEQYTFKKDSVFIKTVFHHLENKQIEEGTYFKAGDTLHLQYRNASDENKSVKIVEKRKSGGYSENSKDALHTQIQVYYDTEEPQPEAHLKLINDENNIVMALASDKNGLFPFFSIPDTSITQVKLSSLGMIDQTIPTADLFGYFTEIEVLLSNTSVNAGTNQSGKYLVSHMDDGKIILTPITSSAERMVLEKTKD